TGVRPVDESLQLRVAGELPSIALDETVPTRGIVAEPSPELGARRHLAAPLVDRRRFTAEATRPETIDQHAIAVVGSRVVVHAPQPDARCPSSCATGGAAHGAGVGGAGSASSLPRCEPRTRSSRAPRKMCRSWPAR